MRFTMVCPICQETFTSQVRAQNHPPKYCSTACYHRAKVGEKRPEAVRERIRAAKLGANNPMWKGGSEWEFSGRFYVVPTPVERTRIPQPRRPNMPRAWRVWLAAHPGEQIEPGANIHHKDEIPGNDVPSNLVKLTRAAHRAAHLIGVPKSAGVRRKIAESLRGRVLTPEHRAHIAAGSRRKREETRHQALL